MSTELAAAQIEYHALFKSSKFKEAAQSLNDCAGLLDSPELRQLVTQALAEPYLRTIEDSSTPLANMKSALSSLRVVAPEKAAAFDAKVAKLETAEAARLAKAEKQRKKSEGVRLGMTPEDVYASSWGRPSSVNRTITRYGTNEQWVYPGYRSFLYFENGVLVSVQN